MKFKTLLSKLNEKCERFKAAKTIPGSLVDELTKELGYPFKNKKVIVGTDIYRYSKYDEKTQVLIPFIFDMSLHDAYGCCLSNEKYLFQNESEDSLSNNFISTGDGGFQILENPIQALVFIAYLETNIRSFNTRKYYPSLRDEMSDVVLRYCVTRDCIFEYNDNMFGPGIIRNARILSKDKLNRCLIDESTNSWFNENINGIETLEVINGAMLSGLPSFSNYNKKYLGDVDLICKTKSMGFEQIISSKIGEIASKGDVSSIYNIYYKTHLSLTEAHGIKWFVTAIGNMHTGDIDVA